MKSTLQWQIRQSTDLPFYCRPVPLFFSVWAMMLAALQFKVSYTSYPDLSLGLMLFGLSTVSFMGGFATLRAAYLAIGFDPHGAKAYRINTKRLRRVHLASVAICLAIMVINLKLYGLPPIFGVFGADTLDYQEYGSLRQVLFPAILVIFVSAPLEASFWRRWGLYIFAPTCFLIYGSRGYLMIMLLQALIVFSLRSRLSKTKTYLVALATLIAAVLLSNLIGNSRNSLGIEALLEYLKIKHEYYDWPAPYLWVMAYVSTPISNMCWIIKTYPYHAPSLSFLSSALPGFWATKPLEIGDLGSDMIMDGVHSYIAKYYLDLWYFGIFGINYVWGLIAAQMSAGDRLSRNYLVSAVLLGCIGFMFFSDFLTILIILLELVALLFTQRYVTIQVPDASV